MPQVTFNIPTTAVPKLKAWIDNIEPALPEDPPRTDADYLRIFKEQVRLMIQKAVKKSEWTEIQAETYNNIPDMEID